MLPNSTIIAPAKPKEQVKNTYFLAIKRAKRDYWNQFLEKEDPKSIYKTIAYTFNKRLEDIFQRKCSAFRNTLFPPPPSAPEPNWEDLINIRYYPTERILAQRLSYLAETTDLLYFSQIRGKLKKSAINAALFLTNKIETNKRLKRKTTTLFLDVKSAFDYIAKNQLLGIFQKLQLLNNLVGSLISLILFLIYIRKLFPRIAAKVLLYIDDISLTIYKLGAKNAIQFDLVKTELIHFIIGKKAKTTSLKLLNKIIVKLKEVVR
ncbi:hypothetical protein DL98DRAFT_608538 [Cadophora sp. DSE1049]|nr:hypothetical protein DL98DRAFT_608538 [Cadophora sp. DSE1049]